VRPELEGDRSSQGVPDDMGGGDSGSAHYGEGVFGHLLNRDLRSGWLASADAAVIEGEALEVCT
jgi:hypothetical protein